MTDTTYQPTTFQAWYRSIHLGSKVALLASWVLTSLSNGAHIPNTAEGWTAVVATVILILVDGKVSLDGAGKLAPPKGQ